MTIRKTIMLLLLTNIFFYTREVKAQKEKVRSFALESYLSSTLADSNEWVSMFVKTNNSTTLKKQIQTLEGRYKGEVKNWHFISLKLNNVNQFLDQAPLTAINFRTYKGTVLNDTMRVNNKINPIHSGQQPLGISYSGEGVIVGFIDTGIDWKHPDFLNPQDSSTRVLAIWDQTQPVNSFTPSTYGYGQLWDSTQIMQNLSNNNDQYGHGSTVAGTACGNAFANGLNKGVAPKTELIVVESDFNASNWLSTIADAVQFIYHWADSLGKPCVLNASLGTYLGSHDGLDPYALYIDSIIRSKEGHLMVAAAGNSGNLGNYHLHTELNNDTAFTWFLTNPNLIYGANSLFFELWADTADFNQITFTVGADKIAPVFEHITKGNYHNIQTNLGGVTYDTIWNANQQQLATVQYWSELRDGQYLLQVFMPNPDSSQYHFRFETVGTGKFDCWTSSIFGLSDMEENIASIPNFTEQHKYVLPDSLQTIVSSFQCLPSVITVGNYYNDSGYVNLDTTWTSNGGTRGMIAETSSRGPTRDGRIKPEIAASGHGTNSALPLNLIAYYLNHPTLDSTLALGGMHRRNGGTSMSSPVVAGVGALVLEKCNKMTPEAFKQALINNAYSDTFTGTLPNVSFGYGKLDGFNTLYHYNYSITLMGELAFCENDSTLISTNAQTLSHYWSTADTTTSIWITTQGNYYVVAEDSLGCNSDTVFFQIEEHPQPQFPVLTVNLDTIQVNNNTGDSIIWYLNGTEIQAGVQNWIIANQNGDYNAQVISPYGCFTFSDTLYFGSVAINTQNQDKITLYPNPSKNQLTLKSNKNITQITLYSTQGKEVQNFENINVKQFKINTSALQTGIYYVRIQTYNDSYVKKIVVTD